MAVAFGDDCPCWNPPSGPVIVASSTLVGLNVIGALAGSRYASVLIPRASVLTWLRDAPAPYAGDVSPCPGLNGIAERAGTTASDGSMPNRSGRAAGVGPAFASCPPT